MNDFKNDYTRFKYNNDDDELIPPDCLVPSQEIPNIFTPNNTVAPTPSSSGNTGNLQNEINKLQNKLDTIHLKGLKLKDIEN